MAANPPEMSAGLPKLAAIAVVVAFLLAIGGLASAIQQPFLIFSAIVPVLAGVGILRRRLWCAYGFALFELAEAAVALLVLLRAPMALKPQIGVLAGLAVILALLFFFAGRSLAATGAQRGWAFPWIAVSCLFTLPLLFFRAFVIPSGGMENTLLLGDRILVRTFPVLIPEHGDIIVFHYPIDRRQIYVKRVIGLPGDRIRIVSQVVYRNGSALTETYVVHKFPSAQEYRDSFPGDLFGLSAQFNSSQMLAAKDMLQNHVLHGEVVVPAKKYFVLGDNRDSSLDSRYWGFVDRSDIIGKAILIYDSEVLDGEISGTKSVRLPQVRWSRIFKFL